MGTLDIFNMNMPQLGKERTIRVWLPKGYDAHPERRYPVLYMHDAQNLFDRETAAYGEIWDVHTTLEAFMSTKGYEGAIVVGIDNAPGLERLDEYSPWVSERVDELKELGEYQRDIGGEGEAYGRFLVETLKPLIDEKYRTHAEREHTGVAGSSMGGFISLYLGLTYPDVFSKIGAFSTAAWFADVALHKLIETVDLSKPIKWYLDIGTEETSNSKIENFNQIYVEGTLAIQKQLIDLGVPEDSVMVVVEEGAPHFETAWARRFPKAFEWLFLTD